MRFARLIPIAFAAAALVVAIAAAPALAPARASSRAHAAALALPPARAAALDSPPAPDQTQAGVWQSLGEYRVTGYCPCVKCCGKSDGITADGTYAPGFEGRLVSAPKDIPFGTKLWIEGVGVVVVHDRGSAIKGQRLELFFQKHKEALQWGVRHRQVWRWTEQ